MVQGIIAACAVLTLAASVHAQGLPDPARAGAADRCHRFIQRTGARLVVTKLKSLSKCTHGILKCVETKPNVPRCLEQARERCEEQLRAGTAAEATLVDAVARKCGADVTLDDVLAPAGLDMARLRANCEMRFGITLTTLAEVGRCLARQHACELERLAAVAAPRAAGLLAAAGVDPESRAALACLTDHGGGAEHVPDARGVGRPLERCARAVDTAALKLVDASTKALGRCLTTLFTCVQLKSDPAAAPACRTKAEKRCALEIANLERAALRPAPALDKACGRLDLDLLRSPEGLRLASLDAECTAVGAGPVTTLAAYADCLVRRHRCGVAVLAQFESPRADGLLADLGNSLGAILCPSLAPTPTASPSAPVATPTSAPPTLVTPTPTPTTPAPTATGPTPSPTPGCADGYEPSAFPDAPVDVSTQCGTGGCTDDGYDIDISGTIDVPGESDFYVLDVTDLPGHSFALQAQLSDVADDTNYDLFLYAFDGTDYLLVDSSTNDGTGSEAVSHSPSGDGASGRYGVEVRGIVGASCDPYTLEIRDPS